MYKLSVDMTESFGQKLQRWREKANLKQAELARRIEVSPTYISNLERDFSPSGKGKPQPSVELCDKIARALGVPIAEVRLAAGYAPPTGVPDTNAVPEEFELLFYFRNLTPERRGDILAITQVIHARNQIDKEKPKVAPVFERKTEELEKEAGLKVTTHKKNPNIQDTPQTQQPVENFEQEIQQLIAHPPFHPEQGKPLLPEEEPQNDEEWLAMIRSGKVRVMSHEEYVESLRRKKQQS